LGFKVLKLYYLRSMNCFDLIRAGDLEALKKLLDDNPEILNSQDEKGFTPLIWSSYTANEEITACLLSYGPDVNKQDRAGNTALMGVSFKGHTTIAKFLLDAGADPNITGFNNSTALMFAASFGHADLVGLLIDFGADHILKDSSGSTAGDLARGRGFRSIAEKLENPVIH